MIFKLKETIFGSVGDVNIDKMYGRLGYIGLLFYAKFKVISEEGAYYLAEIINLNELAVISKTRTIKQTGLIKIHKEDTMETKVFNDKIQYNLFSTYRTKEERIEELKQERATLKRSGMLITNPILVENWRRLQILRGKAKGVVPNDGEAYVWLIKQRVKIFIPERYVTYARSSDESDIQYFTHFIKNELRRVRKGRRIVDTHSDMYGISILKMGSVYAVPNQIKLISNKKKMWDLNQVKKVSDANSDYVGIELEFIYSGNSTRLKELLVENNLQKHVQLVDDGSLRACHNTNYSCYEMRVLVKQQELQIIMNRIDKVLSHPDVDAYTNRSCGTHIHLDMRRRNVRNAFTNFCRVQNVLRASQPVGRIKNTYCKENTSEDMTSYSSDRRYYVINPTSYSKHITLEIRVHEGTIDANSIINWVSFLITIASHDALLPRQEFKLAKDLLPFLSIPQASIDYVDNRINRFNSLLAV